MATIEKEWAEVRRNGVKVEAWSWTVTFYEGDVIDENPWLGSGVIDQHYYKTEEIAVERAKMFNEGRYEIGQHGEVMFPSLEE